MLRLITENLRENDEFILQVWEHFGNKPGGALLKSVPQIGAFLLDEARLDIMKYHYALRNIFDGNLLKPVDPAYAPGRALQRPRLGFFLTPCRFLFGPALT